VSGGRVPLLNRLGLNRPELRAWALYDCANSAFVTTVVTAVFPIYFTSVAAKPLGADRAVSVHLTATTIALVIAAILGPYLGAVADCSGRVKRLLAASTTVAVAATAGLFFVGKGDWALGATLFALGNVGATSAFVFYDALLPRVAKPDEIDRVSAAGYALGYVGGGILLALNLAWISNPASFGIPLDDPTLPARLAFLSAALWWVVFAVPLFRRVPDPKPTDRSRASWRQAFARLSEIGRDLKKRPEAFKMLLAFLLYNDGIGTIIRVAAVYATARELPRQHVVGAILLVQFVGVPSTFAFAWIARFLGAKRAVLLGVGVYCLIGALAYWMETTAHFYALAALVGLVAGGTQALSRSLFASLIPREKTAEFFGFFGVADKFAGIAGPALFALVAGMTGDIQWGVLTVFPFFIAGAWLLTRVDVEKGRAQARSSN
jgi:UMF1 family MFS transporter